MDDKATAIQLIRTLWPSVPVNPANVTPDVIVYVYAVFLGAKESHAFVKALGCAYGPVTSVPGVLLKLSQAVRKYTDGKQDWGLAIRAMVQAHERAIRSAMTYGTDVYPLELKQ